MASCSISRFSWRNYAGRLALTLKGKKRSAT
jgi:hypothetical protein